MTNYIGVDLLPADDLLLALVSRGTDLLRKADAGDVHRLKLLGAVNDDGLTTIGRQLVPLVDQGVPSHLARVLLAGHELGCLRDAVKVVALLRSGRSLRFRPPEGDDNTARADAAHLTLVRAGFTTDLGRLLGAYDAVVNQQRKQQSSVPQFCRDHFLNSQLFAEANTTHQGLLRIIDRAGIKAGNERPDEANLIFALLHGLMDMVVESNYNQEAHRRDRWIYSYRMQEGGWIIAPGSGLHNCRKDMLVLPLYILRGQGRSGRSYTGHAVAGRPYSLITEAVEVSQELLVRAEAAKLYSVTRFGHHHSQWGSHKDTVVCRENWYVGGDTVFTRECVPAPAGLETGEAFASSLTRRDDDDIFRNARPIDPLVKAASQLAHFSGGRFPDFSPSRVVAALGGKLADTTSWLEVERRDRAGLLKLTWGDLAAACGMEEPKMLALRGEIETTYPAMLTVAGVELPVLYGQQEAGEVARVEVDVASPALRALNGKLLPEVLARRTVYVVVTGINKTGWHRHGTSMSSLITEVDDLRQRVALAVNQPSPPELPAKVGELVQQVDVHHDDRKETLYVVFGVTEPFTDRAEADAAALSLVQKWLVEQAEAAASPHALEDDLKVSSLASAGQPQKLPTTEVLTTVEQTLTRLIKESIERRLERRRLLLDELATLQLHGNQHRDAFNRVTDAHSRAALLLRNSALQVVLPDSVLEEAAAAVATVREAMPVIDDIGARSLALTGRLQALQGAIRAVNSTDFRRERREACDAAQQLIRKGCLDEAEAALTRADALFADTTKLEERGQTRRLRGGKN